MKNERENKSSVNLTAANGVPMVSFTAASGGAKLSPESFNIAGNDFTAYYDAAHKLVFVLDKTLDARKPNVLLVINSVDDRKWDDILANDHGVDLETVRPKVDNKYQKLDIEYSGLPVYNALINEFKAGADLTAALAGLSDFRTASIRRAAADRLDAANESTVKTRETISKTGETLRELQARLKKLREKLSRQKKEVGKEPTKQSASKILKTEAQIDATNDKLHRAKKRLTNAQRRLAATEDDADIARRILDQKVTEMSAGVPAVMPAQEIVKYQENRQETKAETMADEKVKPLFDKDPEILDEKIAFKPIDFNMPIAVEHKPVKQLEQHPVAEEKIYVEETVTPPSPLSFTPPAAKEKPVVVQEEIESDGTDPFTLVTGVPTASPVLDTITSVETPNPVVVEDMIEETPAVAPVTPAPMPANQTENLTQPAPISSGDRPVSPLSGPITPVVEAHSKPKALYYIMLVVLIVLSVFTLWLYQRNTANTVPDLSAPAPTELVTEVMAPAPVQAQPEPVAPSPFIQVELNKQPEPVLVPTEAEAPAAPIVASQPMVDQPVELVGVEASAAAESMTYDDIPTEAAPMMPAESVITEPVYQEAEVLTEVAAPAPAPQIQLEKPAYNVSQQEKMFVASPDYETEDVYYDDAGYDASADAVYDDSVADEYYE